MKKSTKTVRAKRKLAISMLSNEERKLSKGPGGKKFGIIVFESKAWKARREAIALRVSNDIAKAKELKRIRLEKLEAVKA